MARDDFSKDTVTKLAERVGFLCSNPACRTHTVGPNSEQTKSTRIGKGAHITAASIGGPRYDANLTPKQRCHISNGIWLCANCADLIDKDENTFSTTVLVSWKSRAELEMHKELKGEASNHRKQFADFLISRMSTKKSKRQIDEEDEEIATLLRNEIDFHKKWEEQFKHVSLETFSINSKRCRYIEHRYNPNKPFWPTNDTGSVTYGPNSGPITVYGLPFKSWVEAKRYGEVLRQTRNHMSFNENSIHTIYFERQESKAPNYPIFYFAIRNDSAHQIILKSVQTEVYEIIPLLAIGQSQTLEPLEEYEIKIPPTRDKTEKYLVPSIKIAQNDSAAFGLRVVPMTGLMGGYEWLMKFKLLLSGDICLYSDYFIIIM